MIATVHAFNIIIPFAYLITVIFYYIAFQKQKQTFSNGKRVALFITLVFHLFYLLARTIEFNHPPITTKFEIFTVLAFTIAFSYFLLELVTDIRGTGLFILLFSLLFQIISSLFIEDLFQVKEVLRNRLLGLHVVSALLGYSGFTISAVYGVLFLLLYKQIRVSKFGLFFDKLPSLETLEKMSFYSVIIGFILLTIGIIIGIIWLPSAFPHFKYYDPKIVASGIIWLIYGGGILTKITLKIYGRKFIISSLVGFAMVIISLIVTTVISSTFHSFY